MQNAQFEEKEYEGPLYQQLLLGGRYLATPGQVFENAFGVDALLEAQNPLFWGTFGYQNIPKGIDLNRHRFGWVWRKHGKQRLLPSFPVNLLIQAKRPDFLHGHRADFATLGIPGQYWRFQTLDHQQKILERLSDQLQGKALVVYASPAFHTHAALYDRTEAQTLVDGSSFVTPRRLIGHSSWNYDRPGTVGIAASTPKRITDDSLAVQLKDISDKQQQSDPKDDLAFQEQAIDSVARQMSKNPIVEQFQKSEIRLKDILPLENVRTEVRLFTKILRFYNFVGLEWLVYTA